MLITCGSQRVNIANWAMNKQKQSTFCFIGNQLVIILKYGECNYLDSTWVKYSTSATQPFSSSPGVNWGGGAGYSRSFRNSLGRRSGNRPITCAGSADRQTRGIVIKRILQKKSSVASNWKEARGYFIRRLLSQNHLIQHNTIKIVLHERTVQSLSSE